jgi:hypothetical protein
MNYKKVLIILIIFFLIAGLAIHLTLTVLFRDFNPAGSVNQNVLFSEQINAEKDVIITYYTGGVSVQPYYRIFIVENDKEFDLIHIETIHNISQPEIKFVKDNIEISYERGKISSSVRKFNQNIKKYNIILLEKIIGKDTYCGDIKCEDHPDIIRAMNGGDLPDK